MITSLHSPHVAAVKALLGSRGSRERRLTSQYIIEGAQNLREAILYSPESIETIYLTADGREKLGAIELPAADVVDVSDEVMKAMADTVTPQGILAVAKIAHRDLKSWLSEAKKKSSRLKIAYFWQIQDPGNAGTVIRTADAFEFDAIIFSDNSVDIHAPKVVRSTAGSLWHIPIFEGISLEALTSLAGEYSIALFATQANARRELIEVVRSLVDHDSIWIFGNEARGIPSDVAAELVSIPMSGRAESLNLASAAAVVMYAVANGAK